MGISDSLRDVLTLTKVTIQMRNFKCHCLEPIESVYIVTLHVYTVPTPCGVNEGACMECHT